MERAQALVNIQTCKGVKPLKCFQKARIHTLKTPTMGLQSLCQQRFGTYCAFITMLCFQVGIETLKQSKFHRTLIMSV